MIVVVGGLVGVAALGVGASYTLESNNGFCNSCHVHDEIYERFTTTKADLASEHRKGGDVKCIGCHREPGVGGALASMTRAGGALVNYLTDDYETPIKAIMPPSVDTCLKCHSSEKTGEQHIEGHFHDKAVIDEGGERMGEKIYCATCHSAHDTDVNTHTKWIATDTSAKTCVACHEAYGLDGDGKDTKTAELDSDGKATAERAFSGRSWM